LDPSMSATGLVVINPTTGQIVAYDCIETEPNRRMALKSEAQFDRAIQLGRQLTAYATFYHPVAVCLELPAGAQSASAAVCLGMCKGIVAGCLASNMPYALVLPGELKRVMTGDRNGSKEAVCVRAEQLYPLPNDPGEISSLRGRSRLTKVQIEAISDAIGAWEACKTNPIIMAATRVP